MSPNDWIGTLDDSSPMWMNGKARADRDMTGRAYNRPGRALSSRCDLGPILARPRAGTDRLGRAVLRVYVAAGRAWGRRGRAARRGANQGDGRRVRLSACIALALVALIAGR